MENLSPGGAVLDLSFASFLCVKAKKRMSVKAKKNEQVFLIKKDCYEKQRNLEDGDSVRHLDTDSSIDCDGNNQLHGSRTHLPVIQLMF